MQVLPTPESPISNSLTNKSYCFAIIIITDIYITDFFSQWLWRMIQMRTFLISSDLNPKSSRYTVNIFPSADITSFLNPFVHDVTHKQKQRWDKES